MRFARFLSLATLASIAAGAIAMPVAPVTDLVSVEYPLLTDEAVQTTTDLVKRDEDVQLERRSWSDLGWVLLRTAPKYAKLWATTCLILPKCAMKMWQYVGRPIADRVWKFVAERRGVDDEIPVEMDVMEFMQSPEELVRRTEEMGRKILEFLDAMEI